MKSFFQFFTEASQSQASMQARKLGLRGDGHGGWVDKSGKVVARTDQGKLKFIDKRQAAKQEEPQQRVTAAPKPQETAASKRVSAPETKAKKTQEPEQPQGQEEGNTLTVVFGRFNPPTVGHEKLLSSAKRISTGGDIKIYPSRTQDPKKNPLDPDIKISYMKKMFPEFKENIINDLEMKSIFNVLVTAEEDGYSQVNIVVGSDRQAEFESLAQKYNGELYNFDQIRVVSAGVRDADAEGVEGMSASKMRKAVLDDDFDSFRRGTPKTLDDAETQNLFNAVRQGMSVKKSKIKKENYNMWEIAPKLDMKNLRENYISGQIFNVGDVVENMNTGMVGIVIRRGTNHLICVTEDNIMFKSWIKDLNEYTEVKMERMQRLPGKPNTLVGTGGFRKLAMKMTGTTDIKNFINKHRIKK
jgi:hypothetical protein